MVMVMVMSAMRNIILIGMPGAGKSTVGMSLARRLQKPFIDTDALIETAESASLQTIVDTRGQLALRAIEEKILCALDLRDHVIATGGSVVYSDAAMAHLQAIGRLVYLQLDLATLERRVANFSMRGLARRADQTFADLYRERVPLYERYAQVTVACDGLDVDGVCTAAIAALSGSRA